jgi:hypothetical protein
MLGYSDGVVEAVAIGEQFGTPGRGLAQRPGAARGRGPVLMHRFAKGPEPRRHHPGRDLSRLGGRIMRKTWLIGAALALVAGAAFWIEASRREPWTTDSPQALAEYEKGRQAQMKFYFTAAAAAFERALELDPSFIAAKLALLDTERSKEERERLIAELRDADRSRLSERERFLLDVLFARVDGEASPPERDGVPAEHRATSGAQRRVGRRPGAPGLASGAAYRRLLEVDPGCWRATTSATRHGAGASRRRRTSPHLSFRRATRRTPHTLGELLSCSAATTRRARAEEALRVRRTSAPRTESPASPFDRRPGDIDPIVARVELLRRRMAGIALRGGDLQAFLTGDDDAPWARPTGARDP